MKKSSLFLLVLALTFCLSTMVPSAFAAGKLEIRLQSDSNPRAFPDQPTVVATQKLAEELENRLGDKVNVRIYWDQQLAKTYEAAVNLVQNGNLQLSVMPMSTFAEFSKACLPLANLFLIPYPHTQLAYDVIDGKVGDIFRERIVEETGLRVAAFWDVGFRHLISVKKPITNLESISGMKFRVQPNPVHIAAFKLLNTNPTPISWGELFTSLQQGVVDGTENPLENVMSGRIYEVCKEMALTGHLYEFLIVFSNEQWYQNLPEDIRKEWDESLQAATEAYRTQLAKKNSEWLDFFTSKGMNITTLSPEELVKFRESVKPSQEETIKQVGQEYHDMIINEIAKTEKEYFEKHPELR